MDDKYSEDSSGGASTPDRVTRPRKRPSFQPDPIIAILVGLMITEAAAIAYFYAKYYSQNVIAISLNGKLMQASTLVKAQKEELLRQSDALSKAKATLTQLQQEKGVMEKGIADKKAAILTFEQRLRELEADTRVAKDNFHRQEEIAAYLRKRLKESKETEMQMSKILENLTQKQKLMESELAWGKNTPPGDGTADVTLKETVVAETGGSKSSVLGQILILNDKYNFAILNVGSDDGIAAGDSGIIEYNGTVIGSVKVKKLYNRMCLADIVQSSQNAKATQDYAVRFTRSSS